MVLANAHKLLMCIRRRKQFCCQWRLKWTFITLISKSPLESPGYCTEGSKGDLTQIVRWRQAPVLPVLEMARFCQ
jgi:hypothetical protein